MTAKKKTPDFLSSVQKPMYNAVKEREQNIIGKRLSEARQERGLSLTAMSELLTQYGLTVHRQGISKWEMGGSVPSAYQLLAVCHALKIEDGISYFTGEPDKESLNAAGQRKLNAYKDDLIASGRYRPQMLIRENVIEYIDMRISDLPASAGTGEFLNDDSFTTIQVPKSKVPYNADFGVRVSGDSMEPVYHDGQIVWVQQCNSLRSGEVGIFICDGEGFIKLYNEQKPEDACVDDFTDSSGVLHMQPVLISYNKRYEPKLISSSTVFRIAGRVLN